MRQQRTTSSSARSRNPARSAEGSTDGAARLREQATAFFDGVNRLTAGPRPSRRLEPVGNGLQGIAEGLDRLEGLARSSVWNMQRRMGFQVTVRYQDMNARTVARGLDTQLVLARPALEENPMLASTYPYAVVGPVFGPLLVIDGQCAVVPGALDLDGRFTAWSTTDVDLVAEAIRLWQDTRAISVSLAEAGTPPQLAQRQIEVAQMLAQGLTDRVIAQRLGVSERTVAADIQRISRTIGGNSRAATTAARLAGWA